MLFELVLIGGYFHLRAEARRRGMTLTELCDWQRLVDIDRD